MKRFSINKLFCILGLAMLLSEIIKQYLLTFIVGNGTYNFWHFPFQLCSMPMYCLLFYSFCKNESIRNYILIFLADYSLLGGIFAFFDTSGMHYSIKVLTVHSYLWHVTMILIGLTAGWYVCRVLRPEHYFRALTLYSVFSGAAVIINLVVTPFGKIDMFYINPKQPMIQIFFRDISEKYGNVLGISLYIAACIAGGGIIHLLWVRMGRYRRR